MIIRSVSFAVIGALVLSGGLALSEVGRRILDGYDVWNLELVKNLGSTDLTWSNGRPPEALLSMIKVDPEADTAWFYDRPQPITGTTPEWAQKRRVAIGVEANYVWNAAVIKRYGINRAFVENLTAHLDDIFTFRSPNGELYPQYRFYPDIQTGIGFTNRFGWRSGPIASDKPPHVIRVGFLGDSTTSVYPAMLERWLAAAATARTLEEALS